ncbi:uncharacterized protein [Venturia canescens]|uniref:uncharacterized protein n=1 Tax=Venturia canescens TaxID=32260 RepID=UPI001C9BD9BD|nr:uncharacterized protein LOC122418997 [Venturia canescens]
MEGSSMSRCVNKLPADSTLNRMFEPRAIISLVGGSCPRTEPWDRQVAVAKRMLPVKFEVSHSSGSARKVASEKSTSGNSSAPKCWTHQAISACPTIPNGHPEALRTHRMFLRFPI